MTDYNDGKWQGWNGGECPVHPESIVETVGKVIKGIDDCQPSQQQYGQAKSVLWNSFEGAFRVVKEYREPREFWVDPIVGTSRTSPDNHHHVHVREVLE